MNNFWKSLISCSIGSIIGGGIAYLIHGDLKDFIEVAPIGFILSMLLFKLFRLW